MIEPAFTQSLEATPTVADADGDAEDGPELAVEVAQVTLRMVDGSHRPRDRPGVRGARPRCA